MSLNKAMLIGNVGKEPEVRYLEGTQNGQQTKVATFTLATTERYRDRSGEVRENTEWHNIVVWRGLADTAEKYVHKGTQLYVEGRIRTRSWTDQTGAKRFTTERGADHFQLLGRTTNSQPQGQTYPPTNRRSPCQAQGYPAPQGGASYQSQASQPYRQPYQQPQPLQGPSEPQIDLEAPADDLPF